MYQTFPFQEGRNLASNNLPDKPTYHILSTVVNQRNGRICYLALKNSYFIGNNSYPVRKSSPLELQLCLGFKILQIIGVLLENNDQVKTFFGFEDWSLKY